TSQALTKGDYVEVITGRLAGLKGELIDIQGRKKIMVRLEHLRFTLQIEIPRDQVRRINRPSS
ncbi:MAG: KOW motif-containing protein, partial [Bacteroidota bacterium]